ncbi:MAG: S8 family serine peptidase [candidate division Zixibacteria bacterium]|nr:S8 family serine peptidase [candidate division Zixibacteria bacterium]
MSAAGARAAVISPRAQNAAAAGDPVWIFLKDKGPSATVPGPLAQAWISERAASRIASRGAAYDPRLDQPIFSDYLDALTSAGLTIRTESRWLNAVSGIVPSDRLAALAAYRFVDSIRPVVIYRRPIDTPLPGYLPPAGYGLVKPATFDYGNSAAQAEAIEADLLHNRGLDGQGVRIGFLDTGYSLDLNVFDSLKVIGTRDFINGDTDVGDEDSVQMDHGTSTLSVCGGYLPGELIGIAPRAEYALAKTEVMDAETRIEEDYWVAGLWWIDSLGCDIVSSSLGYNNWYTRADLDGHTATTTKAAELAVARGLLVVNAAGNEGFDGLVAPADGDSVLTVGASDRQGTVADFSSRGPTADNRIKPDVVAPGLGVWTALTRPGAFLGRSGTSFATPLVAGVCALLLQEKPSLSPMQVIDVLRATATNASHPNNDVGWGMVRADHAFAALPSGHEASGIEVWPNPASDSVWIGTPDAATDAPSHFDVFTAAGDPVYSGEFWGRSSLWLGTNESNQPVASGIYLVWVRTPIRDGLVKLALIRRR